MSALLQAHRERVGRQIKKARKRAGLTHDALGAKVGTSRQHLIKLEKGQHLPSDSMLQRISEATGHSVAFFEGEADEDDEESDSLADFLIQALQTYKRRHPEKAHAA